jgi:hypothetical protein
MQGSVYRRESTWSFHASWQEGAERRQLTRGNVRTKRARPADTSVTAAFAERFGIARSTAGHTTQGGGGARS